MPTPDLEPVKAFLMVLVDIADGPDSPAQDAIDHDRLDAGLATLSDEQTALLGMVGLVAIEAAKASMRQRYGLRHP